MLVFRFNRRSGGINIMNEKKKICEVGDIFYKINKNKLIIQEIVITEIIDYRTLCLYR